MLVDLPATKFYKMKRLFVLLLLLSNTVAHAQRYYTKTAKVTFFSASTLENIEAVNYQGVCVIDATTQAIECLVLMKGFEFKKALMQEHFNEDYVESSKYPKAEFKGSLKNAPKSWTTNGEYDVVAEGLLTMHGVSKKISGTAHISIKNGLASAVSKFVLSLNEYNIKIPAAKKDNINNAVQISFVVNAFDVLK